MLERINQKIQRLNSRLTFIDGIVCIIILGTFLLYSILLFYSHYCFFPFNPSDKGIIYQMYYNTLVHGEFFFSSIIGGFGIDWGNRYILLLFLPFMCINTNIPVMFSLISTAILSLGALPVYWLATDVAKSKRIGLLFVALYFFYPSIGWFMLESVKEEIFILPFLLFAFYYMHVKSYPKSMIFLFLALICKHNMLLVLPMFALYAYLENYDRRWIVGPLVLSAGWFLSLQLILRPFFGTLDSGILTLSGLTAGRYEWMGSNLPEIFIALMTNPCLLIQHIITLENIHYIILLFIPFCGISLLKPKILLIGLPIFLQNLLSTSLPMKMITWHYASILVFVIIVSAILAFPVIYTRLKGRNKIFFIIILIIISFSSFLVYGPLVETMHNFHNMNPSQERLDTKFTYLGISQENHDALHTVINDIPHDAKIIAVTQFGPYLYKNRNIFYLDWFDKTLDDKYDYYLLGLWVFKTNSLFERSQKILQRHDMQILYYDGRYVVLGTQDHLPNENIGKTSKLNLLGYRIKPGVGQTHYDSTIGENVFFSSRFQNSKGYLVYGPHVHLPPGDYTIEYQIKAENVTSPDDVIATVDIVSTFFDGSTPVFNVIATKDVYGRDMNEGTYTSILLPLLKDEDKITDMIEFRVFQHLNSDVFVQKIAVNPGINSWGISKLSLRGFITQPGVGNNSYFDSTTGENVFYSSRLLNSKGYLVYGPYMQVPAGNYTIEYQIKAENVTSPDDVIATVDIFSTLLDGSTAVHKVDAATEVYGRDLREDNYTPISLHVSFLEEQLIRQVEFRVFQPLSSDLYVKDIRIIRID